MAQSQFALSWDSYKTNICSGFSSFQQNGELVDMTLAADGHLVKVHQVLIALASPYLKELITTVPTQHPVVFLNNVSHATLSLILEYIYTGEVGVPAENISSFIEAAKALHIRGLENITDSGSATTTMDTTMNETSLDNTRIRKKSDQIILPPNAKKIYVNINSDSSGVVSEQKPLVDSEDDNMQDYTDRMDDTHDDFDYDIEDDNKVNKVRTPGKTDNNKSIMSAKDSAETRKLGTNLQFTVSIRGALQIILNRYIYNLHSTQTNGIQRWRCADYRSKKCTALVTTKGNVVLNRTNPHNHSFHDKKILVKLDKNAVYSALDEAQDSTVYKDNNKNTTESNLAVDFWRRQADELGLPFKVYRAGRLPVCVTTLIGRKPDLPSILLNSHSDVVPVDADLWTYPPFSAHIDDNGDLYGRGAQDTKDVSVQYMEAIKKIIQNNITLDRTVHVMVVPDEETGSFEGLIPFLETDEFKSLNIGFALDEGLTSSDDTMAGTYVDKRPWQMRFNIRGSSGHGSSLQNRSSTIEQVQALINMAMEFRKEQLDIMASRSPNDYGCYSSLNINMINGGLAPNIIPSLMTVVIDVRLSVEQKVSDFLSLINSWLSQLSSTTTVDFIRRVETSAATAVDDSNPYWVAIRDTMKNFGFRVVPTVCPATSDMLLLREIGIPAIGFSSRTNMIKKAHDVDEYIPVEKFLRGIDIYVALIKSLANLQEKQSIPEDCNQEYLVHNKHVWNNMFNVLYYFLIYSVVVNLRVCRIISKFHNELKEYKTDPAVQRLQEYIQIDTSIEENIEHAANFWKSQAAELGLPFAEYRPAGLPICVITIKGAKPELPSIMLNSHADVVPTDADLWTYPPFAAHIDDKGYLYGRGAQDCKTTGVQYLEAIRILRQQNITLDRTVYITIMPDEETGGFKGIVPFVKTEEFKSMNVGFALDEGVPSPSDEIMYAFYTDKRPWQMKFEVHGAGGHGSFLTEGGTIDQVQTLINTAVAYRNQQIKIKESKPESDSGAYTSLNINMIQGGIATNVAPSRMSVVVDVRLAVEEKVSDFQTTVNSWMAKLGNNTKLEFIRRINSSEATAVDDSNQYWVAMQDTLGNLGVTVLPIVCPGTTDMLEIRALGIPAIGFTTNRNIPVKAHDVDEYVTMKTFLEGVEIYAALIKSLANLPAFT
ncbi:uncharacterized protein LOC123869722 [Maniola jurtina]|uniref:uncharacterized protein LOC123869722 n=1 Tax=Maniola jurtina TaxID=191418 RepID=UPI001E686AB9|nr:uncharacterized protein LOC123869722 [Maniola jurtina]